MADTTPHNDAPNQRERYTIGYTEQRTRAFATRTATGEGEGNAGFFSAHLSPGMNVVDCGCGPGSITTGFAEVVLPGKALGIDAGESQIDFARGLAAEGGADNVRFEVGSIYEIPASNGSFDAAYSQAVLEFLKDPQDAVNEMFRVLKPGGLIGLVSTDWGSRIVWPIDPVIEEAWELSIRLWRHNGGNPYLGGDCQSCCTMRASSG